VGEGSVGRSRRGMAEQSVPLERRAMRMLNRGKGVSGVDDVQHLLIGERAGMAVPIRNVSRGQVVRIEHRARPGCLKMQGVLERSIFV
jgi:Cu/Ag efflux pump CusA